MNVVVAMETGGLRVTGSLRSVVNSPPFGVGAEKVGGGGCKKIVGLAPMWRGTCLDVDVGAVLGRDHDILQFCFVRDS